MRNLINIFEDPALKKQVIDVVKSTDDAAVLQKVLNTLKAGNIEERSVDHVHDAVVDRRRCQFSLVIHHTRVPDGRKPLDIGRIYLLERAVAFPVVAHALSGDVLGILAVVNQLFRRLGQTHPGVETE